MKMARTDGETLRGNAGADMAKPRRGIVATRHHGRGKEMERAMKVCKAERVLKRLDES